MSPLVAFLKCLAVCATMTIIAQQVCAAVLILDATTSPSPSVTSVPEKANPQDEPSGSAQSIPPMLTSPGILNPENDPAVAAPAAAMTPSPAVPSDLDTEKVANPAEVKVEMMPGQTVSVGSRVSFRVTSKKAGYLVLVDVDATGHLTQIYPNTASLVRNTRPNGNYIKPGGKLTIPLASDPYGAVEYVVSPPNGQAMIVAILSAQSVQILDLPDVPPEAKNQSDKLAFLARWTSELRIPDDATNQLREARWSFNAKSYTIQ